MVYTFNIYHDGTKINNIQVNGKEKFPDHKELKLSTSYEKI